MSVSVALVSACLYLGDISSPFLAQFGGKAITLDPVLLVKLGGGKRQGLRVPLHGPYHNVERSTAQLLLRCWSRGNFCSGWTSVRLTITI
ncbi:hypothetical protein LZ32DRAFT_611067 [Colletotrichum eremochloae]|nr:hypothetical protein LZ32DRAFT_611067 [Colletotrichum eremochloae]